MFNVLLESNRPRLAVGGSLVLSTIAHLATAGLVVLVMRQPATNAPVADSFIARALFLPPVDRRPAEAGTGERLQFLALGIPLGDLEAFTDGPVGASEFGRTVRDPSVGTEFGEAEEQSVATPAVQSLDSAYSVLDVDSIVQRFPDSDAPLYPPVLLAQAVEGSVHMRYTVDTTGRADMRTTEVLRSDHPYFTEAVLQALPGMRFRPAVMSSRRVRQVVEQEFAFRITSPEVASGEAGPSKGATPPR